MTYSDLNPKFLYSYVHLRTEDNMEHCHDFVEIVIVLKGKSRYIIEGREYVAEEGNFLVLNPGTHHRCLADPVSPAKECYLAFTDVEYVNCPKGYLPLFRDYQIIARPPEILKKELFELCGAIEAEANSCEIGKYFMLKSYLIQVLCLIERFRRQEQEVEEVQKKKRAVQCEFKSVNKKYVIQRITDYMETHYREKISLDQIAENMYLSPYYISKLFKSETGDTPINYLISLRMKKAREILDKSPECSVQDVAAAVGYEDAYHFSKRFKKYYGMSPLYYKARLHG
ncbi:MAG: AraC family transcriptional regulator [Candidatus Limivivens sp.]|nr:AraC family transcriptional regulator [Candidatus Limivivens sp.]